MLVSMLHQWVLCWSNLNINTQSFHFSLPLLPPPHLSLSHKHRWTGWLTVVLWRSFPQSKRTRRGLRRLNTRPSPKFPVPLWVWDGGCARPCVAPPAPPLSRFLWWASVAPLWTSIPGRNPPSVNLWWFWWHQHPVQLLLWQLKLTTVLVPQATEWAMKTYYRIKERKYRIIGNYSTTLF